MYHHSTWYFRQKKKKPVVFRAGERVVNTRNYSEELKTRFFKYQDHREFGILNCVHLQVYKAAYEVDKPKFKVFFCFFISKVAFSSYFQVFWKGVIF